MKLKEQTILAMNGKIKEMENNIKEMSQKTAKAETSVKDIAMKAIELMDGNVKDMSVVVLG